jgi:beta-lactamase class A
MRRVFSPNSSTQFSFSIMQTLRFRGRHLLAAMPVFAVLAVQQSALADTLQTWQVDSRQNRLEFTTDQTVQPIVQLVPNPGRVVIDLPGIRWSRPKLNQPQGGAIQSLRIAKFEPSVTRIVIDLAPGTTVDPSKVVVQPIAGNRWSIQLPNAQNVVASGMNDLPTSIAVPAPPAEVISQRVPVGKPMAWLQQRLASLKAGKYAALDPSAFVVDLDTGNYSSLNGDKVFPAASIIKLPILVAFLQDVEAGKVSLNESLTMTADVVVGEAGVMQDSPVGTKFSAYQTLSNMITISDNTATNMIVKRLGGISAVNRRFQSWGLTKTRMQNRLPDLYGSNTTTAKELVKVMGMLEQGELLSTQKSTAIDLMRNVVTRNRLPRGLGAGATIAHKTGTIGRLLGDSGIVYMPNGKRYLIAVLVGNNRDPDAVTYIQDVSRIVYRYLDDSSTIGMTP